MTKGILGRKIGMTQLFSENGELIPVTVIQAEPNIVLQKRTIENDGYEAIQIGFADKKESQTNKAEKGHAEKADTNPKSCIREMRNENIDQYDACKEISLNIFEASDIVDVTGRSKGKGFQGSIKRHNQSKGLKTHGSRYHRGVGTLGAVDPARVFKGRKLPGQMGGNQVTIQNLEIVNVDEERNVLLVRGNVPGAKKSYVTITSAVKAN